MWPNQSAAANGLSAVRSSVAGVRERTVRSIAASEGEKTHRSVDLLGRVYDWSGATWTTEGCPQGERGGVHQFIVPPKGHANDLWNTPCGPTK